MCVPWAFAEHWPYLHDDAKQAMGEGKGGPVETGLTGPVATALWTPSPWAYLRALI